MLKLFFPLVYRIVWYTYCRYWYGNSCFYRSSLAFINYLFLYWYSATSFRIHKLIFISIESTIALLLLKLCWRAKCAKSILTAWVYLSYVYLVTYDTIFQVYTQNSTGTIFIIPTRCYKTLQISIPRGNVRLVYTSFVYSNYIWRLILYLFL